MSVASHYTDLIEYNIIQTFTQSIDRFNQNNRQELVTIMDI